MSETGTVEWDREIFLKWTDFKAESNPAVFEDSHSVLKYRFTWTVNSNKLDDIVVFLIDDIRLSVEFIPQLSWVRFPDVSDNLLKHEQGHFDLGELVKRENINILQNTFYGKQFPTRGQNQEQRKQFAKEDSGKMIAVEVEKLEQLLDKRREEYDVETEFGQNSKKQAEYDLIFEKLRS
ncbi:MAG: hypothetical protein ACE5DU_01515 [Nitrosopumilus sp.]